MAKNFEFDKPMKDGLDLFKENMGLLIGASLVASLLSVFTLLIISGPMTVGILLVVRQCLKDKQNKIRTLSKLIRFRNEPKTIWQMTVKIISLNTHGYSVSPENYNIKMSE